MSPFCCDISSMVARSAWCLASAHEDYFFLSWAETPCSTMLAGVGVAVK